MMDLISPSSTGIQKPLGYTKPSEVWVTSALKI
ncbi:hypothetical protein AB205_0208120 [Aquarana catesbeiana]|uniref:Uncharacterized protein n=1 Tax=Aquarana catesbeiana TaxID=8400 RepID=A0A2G9RM97_AQUCT|nr:hypothetical protein AB205_0208120 [Aquarana catesbeiana]